MSIHTERFGTRHRAALGITEQTDAVVIVVSEENGQISLVERARIVRNLTEAGLARAIQALLDPSGGRRGAFGWRTASQRGGLAGRSPRLRELGRFVGRARSRPARAAAAPGRRTSRRRPPPRRAQPVTDRIRRRPRPTTTVSRRRPSEPRGEADPRADRRAAHPQLAAQGRRRRPRDADVRRAGPVAEHDGIPGRDPGRLRQRAAQHGGLPAHAGPVLPVRYFSPNGVGVATSTSWPRSTCPASRARPVPVKVPIDVTAPATPGSASSATSRTSRRSSSTSSCRGPACRSRSSIRRRRTG